MTKIAIVTGSSRGIGAATALRLAEEGYDLGINYLNDEQSALRVAEACEEKGVRTLCVQGDVSIEAEVENLFARVDEQLGKLDVLVNNAGILFPQCRLTDLDAERINKVLTTNVTSYFLCAKQAVLRMSTNSGGKGGAIVNVSSVAARTGSGGEYVDYAASKGAIDTFTLGLATEVAEEGIRVNGVRPGFIYTEMHASGGEPGRVDRLKNAVPLKRGGQAEEVAAAIAWLVSSESAYTTGSFIEVAGGR